MKDHSGLRYLFEKLNLNVGQARWLATLNEFDFEMRYIKWKENQVVYALSRKVQVNHIETMRYYATKLQDRILMVGQRDEKYMEIMQRLQ